MLSIATHQLLQSSNKLPFATSVTRAPLSFFLGGKLSDTSAFKKRSLKEESSGRFSLSSSPLFFLLPFFPSRTWLSVRASPEPPNSLLRVVGKKKPPKKPALPRE
jgi:hypothetical protein